MSVTIGRLQVSVALTDRQLNPARVDRQVQDEDLAIRYRRQCALQRAQQERADLTTKWTLRSSWMM